MQQNKLEGTKNQYSFVLVYFSGRNFVWGADHSRIIEEFWKDSKAIY